MVWLVVTLSFYGFKWNRLFIDQRIGAMELIEYQTISSFFWNTDHIIFSIHWCKVNDKEKILLFLLIISNKGEDGAVSIVGIDP